MEATELVALAMQRLGVKGDAELAKKLALDGYNAPSRIRRWRSGQNEPDYRATLALLDAAGLLRVKPARGTTTSAADAETDALLEELEAVVASISQRLRQHLARRGRRESHG